jgi:hypothetical protein
VGQRGFIATVAVVAVLLAACAHGGSDSATATTVGISELQAPDAVVGVPRATDVEAVGAALRAHPDVEELASVRPGVFTQAAARGLSAPAQCDGGGFVVDLAAGTDLTEFARSLPHHAAVTSWKRVESYRLYNRILFDRLSEGPIVLVFFSPRATPAEIAALGRQPAVFRTYRFTDEQYLATFPPAQRAKVQRPLATLVVAVLRPDAKAFPVADQLVKLPGVDTTQPRTLGCDPAP